MKKDLAGSSLRKMLDDIGKAPRIYQPSDFWQELNNIHIDHLSKSDFDNFKRSISGKYFSWGTLGIIAHQLFPMVRSFTTGNLDPISKSEFRKYKLNLGKKVRRFNPLAAQIYRIHVGALFDYVSKRDRLKIFSKVSEPKVGNPFIINYKGKQISQDLCNSVYEFYSIMDYVDESKIKNVAEIGGGYGRLAYVFLKALPEVTYTIIDIPPSLYISQRYLSEVFPKEKIFYYRSFKSFKEVKKEFESSRIRFLMAHQIELLPKKYFDLINNVSTLHEMTKPQIKNYLKQMDRIGKSYIYTKQWRKSRTQVNDHITKSQYPIPKNWQLIFERKRHPIQNWFFDELYKLG